MKRLYTASETEHLWSEALGKKITMRGSDEARLQKLESMFAVKIAAHRWARDLRILYHGFATQQFGMTDEDYGLQVQCLGRELRDYEQFVRETGKSWMS